MAVNNTSAPAVTPVSIPIGPTSYSVHNVGVVVSSATEKLTPQIVFQPVVNKPFQVATTLSTPSDLNTRGKLQSSSPPISSANTVTVAMPQKPMAPKIPQVVTSRSTHPAKTFGVQQLPINARPSVSVPSQMVPRLTQVTTATALGDPGGGYLAKTVPGQTAIIQTSVKPAKAAAQHVFMAPGLRTPAPIKLPTTYPPPVYHSLPSYHIPSNISTSSTGHKSSVAFATSRVLVRPLTAPPANRTTVSMTSSSNSDVNRRSSHVVHQPTTTISISVPAKPNHQPDYLHNPADRTNLATGGKSMYLAPLSSTSTSSFTPKVLPQKRMVVGAVPASFSVVPAVSSRNVTSATSTVVTSVTAFTYSAPAIRLAPITSIATTNVPLPFSKVYPQQATRIHTLQPSVSGISAHVRTTDLHQLTSSSRQPLSIAVTTTQSSIAMPTTVTSLTTTRATSQPVMPMMYWPNPLNLNSSTYAANPSTYQGTTIRPTINVPVTTPIGTSIRIPSAVLVMEPPRGNTQTSIPSYSQGQVPQSVVPSQRVSTGAEHGSLHQPHVTTTQPGGPPHITNMSPKPTILRRPARPTDGYPNKKLTFGAEPQQRQLKTSEHGVVENVQNSGPAKLRYVTHEIYHPNIAGIKPALPGQVPFHKAVTSNGLIQTSKVQANNTIKDYTTTNYIKLGGDKDQSSNIHVGRFPQQTIGDIKIKTEPGFHRYPTQVKSETASSHLAQHQYNLSYHQPSNKPHDVSIVSQQPHHAVIHNMSQPGNKVRHLQQRGGMLTVTKPPNRLTSYHTQHGASPTSIPNAAVLRQIPPNMAQNYRNDNLIHTNIKPETDLTSANLKRDYDKMNVVASQEHRTIKVEPDPRVGFNQNSHLAGSEMVGLSPRKKPRKQTHIIAEDVADPVQDAMEEMSTDDADECEDEPNITTPNLDIKPYDLPGKKRVIQPYLPTPPSTTSPPPIETTTSTPKPSFQEKILKEYTDEEGVRYVHVRERLPILLLNGQRLRQVSNHFTHYSDVKVKAEKRTSFHDPCFNPGKLKAWKVPQFAQQLDKLASLDAEALQRIERIKDGLLQFCQTVLPTSTNGHNHDTSGCMSPGHVMSIPSPSTPCPATTPTSALSATFGKAFSPACSGNAGALNSPKTPLEKKAGRFKDEILKIEEMAQANMQRCNVMQEQLTEAKTSLLKIFDQKPFVTSVVTAGRKIQKTNKSVTNGSRSTKKKKS